MSTLKSGDINIITFLPLLIMLIPIIQKIIQFKGTFKYLSELFIKSDKYFEYNIQSHDVPVVRNYTSTPMMRIQFSNKFLAVSHYINKNLKNHRFFSITEIMSYNSELLYNSEYGEKDIKKYIDLPLNNDMTLICEKDEIYCQYKFVKPDDSNNEEKNKDIKVSRNSHYIITLSIKIVDNEKYIEKINNFVENCLKEYEKCISITKKKNDNKQYIYSYMNSEKVDSKLELYFNEFLMDHNKDLNVNIFFEQKKKLINYIKPFIFNPNEEVNSGEELYKKCGMTFKAGLLFYGEPGCGKTTTIKGILKYTNRHAIIVDLSKVKTCEELESIFRTRKFNRKDFSGKELCYILEDCDAFESNIIKKRETHESEKKITNELSDVIKFMDNMNTSTVKIPSHNDNSLNLSCLLNLLDGIIELNGIMIIMTSNHPEKIDPALIRPGRFDFKCEFKKASKDIIKEMLKLKYNLTDKEMQKYYDLNNIKEYIMSPAQIQCICFKNDNIEECINDIILESQK
jgi:ATP-dependent 26S proteasome regulatory subunit